MSKETYRHPYSRAPVRLFSIRASRQAMLRTSFWLAPSLFTNRPCDLPVEKTRDASNRRLPPKRLLRAPAPRAFPARSRHFRGGESPRSLGLRVALPGTWTFHDVRGRFGGSVNPRVTRALLPHGLETRAWAFSSHGDVAIEPLTPLSRSYVSPSASCAFAPAAC